VQRREIWANLLPGRVGMQADDAPPSITCPDSTQTGRICHDRCANLVPGSAARGVRARRGRSALRAPRKSLVGCSRRWSRAGGCAWQNASFHSGRRLKVRGRLVEGPWRPRWRKGGLTCGPCRRFLGKGDNRRHSKYGSRPRCGATLLVLRPGTIVLRGDPAPVAEATILGFGGQR